MKKSVKKILKTLLIFIFATITVYLTLTGIALFNWFNENQMLIKYENIITELDNNKLEAIGIQIGGYAQALEQSLEEPLEEGTHSLAEYFDPLGFSVWEYMYSNINTILTRYITMSILMGTAISIAYVILTAKKINKPLKIIAGYFVILIIVPQILFYNYHGKFVNILAPYKDSNLKYFYIGYTLIFLAMYIINYKFGKKITEYLNETMKKNK